MSSSRRGSSRKSRTTNSDNQQQKNQTEVITNHKPILNQEDEQSHQTSESPQNFEEKCPQNRRNSRRRHRNRNGKPQKLDKNEEKDDSAGGSGSKLNLDSNDKSKIEDSVSGSNPKLEVESNCDDKFENNEDSASALASNLIVDSGLTELCINGNGEGTQTVEVLNASDHIDEQDDPVKRLEELRMSFQEAELSDDLLGINNQLQEDELLALESIYVDNVFILDNCSGLRCFQVHIHVEVPKGFSISTRFGDDSSQDFSYSFEVEYLPPIILTCLLPRSYPSNDAPLFTISVQWLNSAKISSLCCELDSIWHEQAGQEVIYQWVDWLHNCTFSHLGLGNEIVLGPYGSIRHDTDRRAISGSVSPDMDVPLLKAYNNEQLHESFCRNIQVCCICLSEYPGSAFIKLPCEHFFCWKCLKTFSDIHVAEGTVLKIQCPQPKCDGMIPPGLLMRLLGDEEFERWESKTLEKTLESMSDVVYCPRCETACLEDNDNHAMCSKCFFSFCSLCRERFHVGVTCMTPEMKLLILQERQNSTSLQESQRRREKDLINEIMSLKEIAKIAKQCPSCKMAIDKTEGCNKMVCGNCGKYFCYRCNKQIDGYDHFKNEKCELFSIAEIKKWEERMNGRQIMGQFQAQLHANNLHPCPSCSQRNAKVGNNNHIFCWACQVHYCYLCRKTVKRGSQHFGPNRCKQHTVG